MNYELVEAADYDVKLKSLNYIGKVSSGSLFACFGATAIAGIVMASPIIIGSGIIFIPASLLTRFAFEFASKNFIKTKVISDYIELFDDVSQQICPENSNFKEACELIHNIYPSEEIENHIIGMGGTTERDAYEGSVSNLINKLLQYPELQSYFLMRAALTEDIIKLAPDVYELETKPYLEQIFEQIAPVLHYSQWVHVSAGFFTNRCFEEMEKSFVESNPDKVAQLKYNLSQLYPMLKQRKENIYEAEFKTMMNNSWLQY